MSLLVAADALRDDWNGNRIRDGELRRFVDRTRYQQLWDSMAKLIFISALPKRKLHRAAARSGIIVKLFLIFIN